MNDNENRTTPRHCRYEGENSQSMERSTLRGERGGENNRKRRGREEERGQTEEERAGSRAKSRAKSTKNQESQM